jgi:hypothetical protein
VYPALLSSISDGIPCISRGVFLIVGERILFTLSVLDEAKIRVSGALKIPKIITSAKTTESALFI